MTRQAVLLGWPYNLGKPTCSAPCCAWAAYALALHCMHCCACCVEQNQQSQVSATQLLLAKCRQQSMLAW